MHMLHMIKSAIIYSPLISLHIEQGCVSILDLAILI